MKRLEKDSKTKPFVPGPTATICTSYFEKEYIYIYIYRCGKYITLRDGAIPTILIKCKLIVGFVLIFHYYFLYHICQEII